MNLDIDKVINEKNKILNMRHEKLINLVDILNNGDMRLKPNILPNNGGVYVFWWTGNKDLLMSKDVNRILKAKGPNQREVEIVLSDEWIFHRGESEHIPLYVGKTADSIKKRIGLHLQLKTKRVLNIGKEAHYQSRKATSNQMRDRIDRMFLNEKDTRNLVLENVGLSYVELDGDEESVNRFFIEDRLIGELFPIFNIDIER